MTICFFHDFTWLARQLVESLAVSVSDHPANSGNSDRNTRSPTTPSSLSQRGVRPNWWDLDAVATLFKFQISRLPFDLIRCTGTHDRRGVNLILTAPKFNNNEVQA